MVVEELDVGTILLDVAGIALLDVLLATEGGETPVLGDNDLLATREPRVLLAIMYSLGGIREILTCTETSGEPQWRWHGCCRECGWTREPDQC